MRYIYFYHVSLCVDSEVFLGLITAGSLTEEAFNLHEKAKASLSRQSGGFVIRLTPANFHLL